MNWPIIQLSDFKKLVQQKPEIKEIKEQLFINDKIVNVLIYHYMIEKEDTFDDLISRECRGITFNADTEECICRPFHKFFNINQNKHSLAENVKFSNIIYVGNKYDGSLITPVCIDDTVICKTKKTFFSDQAKMANRFVDLQILGATKMTSGICTNMYELVSKDFQIVIPYDKTELKYLSSRYFNGDYQMDQVDESNLLSSCNSIYEFMEKVYQLENIEGYVIYDVNDLYKIKTKWYLDRHHALNKVSYSTAIDYILNEQVDDIIATLKTFGHEDFAKLLKDLNTDFTNEVMNEYGMLYTEYGDITLTNSFAAKKDFANYILSHCKEQASYLFALYENKDIMPLIIRNKAIKFKEENKNKILYGF